MVVLPPKYAHSLSNDTRTGIFGKYNGLIKRGLGVRSGAWVRNPWNFPALLWALDAGVQSHETPFRSS